MTERRTRKSGLGRGLDALLSPPAAESRAAQAHEVPIDRIRPNRLQPRTEFDEDTLEALSQSIRSQGVIQPLVVREEADGDFSIVAGERRWRAARRAGLEHIPVVLRKVESEQELLELALVENLQRSDLNAVEEAQAYQALRERFGLSQNEIALRVGKARPTITNSLRLLRLPNGVQELLRQARLTSGQARPLLAIDDPERQLELARLAAKKGLTARDLELLVAKEQKGSRRPRKTIPSTLDGNDRAAQERLIRALQTRVEISRRGGRGTIRIHFHSEEELMSLYDRLVRTEPAR